MDKIKKISHWLKNNILDILIIGLTFFCFFNVLNKLDDAFTVIANSLAIFIAIWYFIKFKKETINKIIQKLIKQPSPNKIKLLYYNGRSGAFHIFSFSRQHLWAATSYLSTLSKQYFLTTIFYLFALLKKYFSIIFRFVYKKRWEIISYLFLLLLLLITLGQFFNWSRIEKYQTLMIVMAVLSGGLTIWYNRNRVEKEIEKEKDKEERAEENRKLEFSDKFPKINKIPVLRNFIKWMYKEGWGYSVILILIVLVGFELRIYGLGNYSFQDDEGFTNSAAAGYLFEGNHYRWDWISWNSLKEECLDQNPSCFYPRSFPYTWLVSKSYLIFGISEFSTRIVGVILGTLLILFSYFIFKKTQLPKKAALLVSFALAINYLLILYSRFARMYSFVGLIVLFSFYFFYEFAIRTDSLTLLKYEFKKKYIYLIFLVLSLYLGRILHTTTLILIPVFILFYFIYNLNKKGIKKFNYWGLGVLLFLTGIISYLFNIIAVLKTFITFRYPPEEYIYFLKVLIDSPFMKDLNIILLFCFLFFLLFTYKKCKAFLLVFAIFIFSIIAYLYFLDPNQMISAKYISHIIPFSIFLIVLSFYFLSQLYKAKTSIIIFVFMLLLLLSFNFSEIKSIYNFDNEISFPKYEKAWEVITHNFDRSNEVLMGVAVQNSYYLQKSNITNIISIRQGYDNYKFDNFTLDIKNHKKGWITWSLDKSFHVDSDIKSYIYSNFRKIGGQGIDNTGVEVFYFDESMIK